METLLESCIVGSSLLLSFLLLTNPLGVNASGNRFLGFLFVNISVISITEILPNLGIDIGDKTAYHFLVLANFMLAPSIYLSVQFFIHPGKTFSGKDLLHFIPGISAFTCVLIEWFFRDSNTLIAFILSLLLLIAFMIQLIIYCIVALIQLTHHRRKIQFYASSEEHLNLRWLSAVIICLNLFAVSWVVDILFGLSEQFAGYDIATSVIYLIFILTISYFVFKQRELFPFRTEVKEQLEQIIQETPSGKTAEHVASQEIKSAIEQLHRLMTEQQPWLDSELSLPKLSSLMQCSTHELSYILNQGIGENFYQFVNTYRIEAAKELLSDKKSGHLSIEGIGYEVGFNSKTTFNTTFKKYTGLTPSDWKKKHPF